MVLSHFTRLLLFSVQDMLEKIDNSSEEDEEEEEEEGETDDDLDESAVVDDVESQSDKASQVSCNSIYMCKLKLCMCSYLATASLMSLLPLNFIIFVLL